MHRITQKVQGAGNDIIDIRAATNNHLIGPMLLADFTDLILISSEMEYCCGVSAPAPEMATDSGMSPWPSVTQNNNTTMPTINI